MGKYMMIAIICCTMLFMAACSGGDTTGDAADTTGTGEETGGTTTTETSGVQATLENLALIRPDGTELALSARPIPQRVRIKATLSNAIAEAADRQAVEGAFSLKDPAGDAIAGTFTWAADFTSVTFAPTKKLDHATAYTANLDSTAMPTLSLSKDYAGATAFTTMAMGDVNGDGYSDALVGADSAPNGTGPGRAYIFHGSASGIPDKDLASASANAIISGAVANDGLGYSLASAGDVNGDGFADIVVGAHRADAGGTERGMAYVFLGSANGIADCNLGSGCTATASIAGATDNSEFGYSMSSAGDVNGDGFDDIIVGAYMFESTPGVEPGQANVFFGGPSLTGALTAASNSNVKITGDIDGDDFGWSVASAGDVNGDGFDDVIIGANGHSPYYASIFNGGPTFTGNLTPIGNGNTRLVGSVSAVSFGNAVNTAGDINGDDFDDVIVGANYESNTGFSNTGATYVFLGTPSGVVNCNITTSPDCPHAKIIGGIAGGKLGSAVASAGDINSDGFDDILVGASHQGSAGQSFVYLFLGSDSGIADCDIKATPTCPDTKIGSKATNDYLGLSVNTAGDVNGDGFTDIILGAPYADTASGEAYILHGSANGIADCNLATCTADTTFMGAANGDRLGYSVN
jgi:hypothetical protein